MRIQQAEGWYLWEKLIVMPRQALRRTIVSRPRRDRLASVLVVLLTGIWVLGTPASGGEQCRQVALDCLDTALQIANTCINYIEAQCHIGWFKRLEPIIGTLDEGGIAGGIGGGIGAAIAKATGSDMVTILTTMAKKGAAIGAAVGAFYSLTTILRTKFRQPFR